ncbi:MAG: hypothetical protein KIT22_04355 [Verrucomicrobiae bacterium]|nr:hypothetical protein [Verrucomicrobiae bacterium]
MCWFQARQSLTITGIQIEPTGRAVIRLPHQAIVLNTNLTQPDEMILAKGRYRWTFSGK